MCVCPERELSAVVVPDATVVQERAIGVPLGVLTYAMKVLRTSRSTLILSIWPRYLSLRFRMAKIRSKSGDLDVSLYSLLVILLRHLQLNPFSVLLTFRVSSHASHPCVSVEQTANLYNLNFSDRGSLWSLQRLLSSLKAVCAITILCLTSAMQSLSA